MKCRNILILFLFTISFLGIQKMEAQELSVSLNVATAGTLSSLIKSSKKNLITELTLTGKLNSLDICYIREMAGSGSYQEKIPGILKKLDLSGAQLVSDDYIAYHHLTYDNKISPSMFHGCYSLTSITIPNSVISICEYAFAGCTGLTSIIIPEGVTDIGEYAFSYCTGLTSVTIGNNVTYIGQQAFSYCSGLTSITIPNVDFIGLAAFYGCTNLKTILVEGDNGDFYSIDGVLFKDSGVTYENETMSGVTLIAFPYANSTNYTIPNGVASIGEGAFASCADLTSLTIPNSITSICNNAFVYCSGLTSITIPNADNIGLNAFYGCTGLTSLTIGKSVTSIGDNAFNNCTSLKEIHCKITTPFVVNSNCFENVNKSCKLFVPKGSYSSYSISEIWGDFTNLIEEDVNL